MQISLFGACTILLPLIHNGVWAETPLAQDALRCVTLSGSNPAYQVETTTTTKTNEGTAEHHVTITPKVTVTPADVTATKIVSSTIFTTITTSGSRGIFTTTVTATSTIISTSVITQGATTTSTTTVTSIPTTTASTISGFVGVQSSLPGLTNDKPQPRSSRKLSRRGKQCKPKKSSYETSVLTSVSTSTSTSSKDASSTITSSASKTSCALPDTYGQSYPSKVVCETTVGSVITTTLTSTAEPTTIVAPTPTVVFTSTQTVTSTSTVAGAAVSTTITASAPASTITSTIVTTSLSTTTVIATASVNAPAATAYAACQNPNNYASYYNGFSIFTAVGNAVVMDIVQQPGTDYTSCCNSCQETANCSSFGFRIADKTCFFFSVRNTCTVPDQFKLSVHYDRTLANPNFVIGNGRCGQFNNVVDDTPQVTSSPVPSPTP